MRYRTARPALLGLRHTTPLFTLVNSTRKELNRFSLHQNSYAVDKLIALAMRRSHSPVPIKLAAFDSSPLPAGKNPATFYNKKNVRGWRKQTWG
jgi:hypothetical protein